MVSQTVAAIHSKESQVFQSRCEESSRVLVLGAWAVGSLASGPYAFVRGLSLRFQEGLANGLRGSPPEG